MSSILFEGNTYTFGATVSANPGTGTTSYVFGGLNSGSTYGFIVFSFNDLGYSSIVGPVVKTTIFEMPEVRSDINVFSFSYVGLPETIYNYYEAVELNRTDNLLTPSENWFGLNGQGLSLGSNTYGPPEFGIGNLRGTRIYTPNPANYAIWRLNPSTLPFNTMNIPLTAGQTYYFSIWMNVVDGATGMGVNVIGWPTIGDFAGVNSNFPGFQLTQLAPTIETPGTIRYPSGSGITAWQRFIFRFHIPSGNTYTYVTPAVYIGYEALPITVFGAQLDTGTGGTAKSYLPNWLTGNFIQSGTSYDSPFFGGNTVYDASPGGIAAWPYANGMTYFWPQHQVRPAIGLNSTLVNQGFKEYYTYQTISIMKALPAGKRAFRPTYFDNFYPFVDYTDSLSGSATGYYNTNGWTSYYYGENGTTFGGMIQSATAYINNMWPEKGICGYVRAYDSFISLFSACGGTFDYVFWDMEGMANDVSGFLPTPVGTIKWGYTGADLIRNDPRYSQSWNGVTALSTLVEQGLNDIYMRYGNTAWYRLSQGEQYSPVARLWSKYMSYYVQKVHEIGVQTVYNKYFPQTKSSNYGNYYSESKFGYNMVMGNGSSPVLYGDASLSLRTKYMQRYNRNKLIEHAELTGDKVRNINLEGMNFANTGYFGISNVIVQPDTSETLDPFGLNRANKVTETNIFGAKGITRVFPIRDDSNQFTFSPGEFHVLSAYFKRPFSNGVTFGILRLGNISGQGLACNFNLTNGTTGSIVQDGGIVAGNCVSANMEFVGNSWYRCWVSFKASTAADQYIRFAFGLGNTSGSSNTGEYLLQGYTGNTANSLYLFGGQLERGSTPSTHYPLSYGPLLSTLNTGWLSFIDAVKIVRSCKRASYNTPLRPWITDPSFYGEFSLSNEADNYNRTEARPNAGWANQTLGYNPRFGMTFTNEGGYPQYYTEMLKHVSLHGTEAFPMWTRLLFKDLRYMSYTSSISQAVVGGFTAYKDDIKIINDALHEVNQRIGGFTLTTGDITDCDWDAKYIASGAPGPNGNTWWWRVTTRLGNTISVNGYTLPDINGNIGTWVSTTGPTLAYVPITVL